ncbi:formylmethanofuran dehydrogenase [Candidatus Acetothermia bacterium]|nr:MAG: formylmethanofuran dehydrogenase [Candidatus Acetothermia bacterium]
MGWLKIDPGMDPRELWELGVRLHGHRGPFLACGIRMGLLALRLLGSTGYSGIRAVAETGSAPPVSCLVDGLQISTGCTAGKGNLGVEEGGRPAARFAAGGREIAIALRAEVARKILDGGAGEDLVEWVLSLPEEELFEWRER